MTWSRLGLLAALVVGALLAVGCNSQEERSRVEKVQGLPGSRVEVNGRKLYFECAGSGTPTVVLEAGLGNTNVAWDNVVERIAHFTRVCAYDRLGLGFSEGLGAGSLDPRTAAMQVDDLALLLDRGGMEAPYVVVGHSWGGALVRMFAGEHGNDTAGVVMIDSFIPFADKALIAAMPPQRPGEDLSVTELRTALRPGALANNDERIDFVASAEQVDASDDLGDIPVIVVTAGRFEPEDLPPALKRRLQEVWVALGTELAKLSSDGVHVVASKSLHHVQSSEGGQPDVVVAAVRGVVDAVRDEGRLGSCNDLFGRLANAVCVR